MNKRISVLLCTLLLTGVTALGMSACTDAGNTDETTGTETRVEMPAETEAETVLETVPETQPETAPVTVPETLPETVTETETLPETIPETVPETLPETEWKPNVSASDLDPLMKPLFGSNEVKNETVMFIEKTDEKTLLYPIDAIVSVTSYDGKKVYEEGKDYVLKDGKLTLTEGTSIPVITAANYYNVPNAAVQLQTMYQGKPVNTYWGEGITMNRWQINVNYTHSATWEGKTQPCELETFTPFLKKLEAGEDVTIVFYGDSITYGASATYLTGYNPKQYTYPILFTQALADLFDYTVHYEPGVAKVPDKDYVAGTRGTITYLNTAVGGWTSQDGVTNLQASVLDKIATLGCDLFVVGFGMNDGGAPAITKNNVKKMADGVLSVTPDSAIALVSTMVPNPDATNGWYAQQDQQESQLLRLAKDYREDGVSCAVSRVTTVSLAVLERKSFNDYTGNNINHPNDFFVRVYAQTLLEAVVGYENMN